MEKTILEAVKLSLRLTTDVFDDEIEELIAAASADLVTGGVRKTDTDLPLVRQAVKFYCRANFANGNGAERDLYQKRYEQLKNALAVCSIYGEDEADGT